MFAITAMTFCDTIKDISLTEAKNLVLEATGFRQGVIVGEGFRDTKQIDTTNVVEWLSNTYAPAGWGKAKIKEFDKDKESFVLQLKDDWEYKSNRSAGEYGTGVFVPCHYTGVFTALLKKQY
ncbi:hypothetical protein [Mesobacillus foraminis]|uniref:hypothetical protein n=1 Tax=Mesobacillus foraminis TaxID=279826 RepID=UPI0020357B2D|nr:hypothetical protein [Mesobacillus foraminis]